MTERPLIVGAGAAGLAVAATLKEHGVDSDVLERADTIGSSWAGRYDSLQLHTIRWLSGLPGMPIPRTYGSWVARDDVVRYLRDYASANGVRPEFGVEVTRVDRDDDGWVVETSAGSRHTSNVVMATSFTRQPYLPDWAADPDGKPPLLHSSQYRNPDAYRGQDVLVVGAGNSASEIAVDLARAGVAVSMSVRTPPNIVRRDTLGVPSQLLGIALRRVPERVMNPVTRRSATDQRARPQRARPARAGGRRIHAVPPDPDGPDPRPRLRPGGQGRADPDRRCGAVTGGRRRSSSPTAPRSRPTLSSRPPAIGPVWSRSSAISASSTSAARPGSTVPRTLAVGAGTVLRRHRGAARRTAARDRHRGQGDRRDDRRQADGVSWSALAPASKPPAGTARLRGPPTGIVTRRCGRCALGTAPATTASPATPTP